tara:strand:+ start:471 stop:1001 length:531 start_codon:yes stop_codon:yes gene_type:complete
MSKLLKYGQFLENVNPALKTASTVLKGVSFFANRMSEKRRLARLGKQYDEDLSMFTDEIIPEQVARYSQQADYYQQQGDLATKMIYDRAIGALDQGGQTNTSYGGADIARNKAKSLMDMQLQSKAAQTQQANVKTQQALGDALNTVQMQIDATGAEYAKQGLSVDEYNINTDLKYV